MSMSRSMARPRWLLAVAAAVFVACGGSLPPLAKDTEPCNGFDDDQDGTIDEGCPCSAGQVQKCYPTPPKQLLGQCSHGEQRCVATGEFGTWGACVGAVLPREEICGNQLDESCDGKDEACPGCPAGETRACYDGPAQTENVGACRGGTQLCLPTGQWQACQGSVLPAAEVCGNGVDEDCDGEDQPCPVTVVTIALDGDCLTASCPAEAPYPVGCELNFGGDDQRGCVASDPDEAVLYFQEGDYCGDGHISGELRCSSKPGGPLDETSCPMNKPTKIYVSSRDRCPALKD